jgi:hypothetical protein
VGPITEAGSQYQSISTDSELDCSTNITMFVLSVPGRPTHWFLQIPLECLSYTLRILFTHTGTSTLLWAQATCSHEFLVPVVNCLPGWWIRTILGPKLSLNMCSTCFCRILTHREPSRHLKSTCLQLTLTVDKWWNYTHSEFLFKMTRIWCLYNS